MADNDSLRERGRALEEDYFRKKDRELVERMRQSAAAEQARQDLGAASALRDPAILAELQELGFSAGTIPLLPLVPALQMAWAEGGVTAEERDLLVRFARTRGIAEGSPADQQLTEWMRNRPDEAVFARAGRLIQALLEAGAPTAAGLTSGDLVQYAEKIAAASGGIFGFGKVSAEEKSLLTKIAADLEGRGRV
jgi:hypothetical protein